MLKFFSTLFFILSVCAVGLAQGWTDTWENLYSENNITVELQYYVPSISFCNPTGKEFKYKYRVQGKFHNGIRYLNWKVNYVDCNGDLVCQRNSIEIGKEAYEDISNWKSDESLEYKIPAESIDGKAYGQQVSSSPNKGRDVIARPQSTDPQKIDGARTIYLGEEVELTVKGGSLGIGADWYWYEGRCGGQRIGQGKTIKYSPADTKRVFVRAEGTNNMTQCAEVEIEVDKRSKAPSGISGREKICKGEPVVLAISGGTLGKGAEWYWYTGSCGTRRIGTGSSINVTPTTTTQYFVRAEGDLNTTPCASITVSVNGRSSDPASAATTNSAICEGQVITLIVKNGSLADDAEWHWYDGGCGGRTIGRGASINISPASSTSYYVRGEGVCNNTACVSVPVIVIKKVTNYPSISAPDKVFKGKKTILTVKGTSLPTGVEWQWYKDGCGTGKPIGTGASINVRPQTKTNYYVMAAGQCQQSNCGSTTLIPEKVHFSSRYYKNKHAFLQYGFGAGLTEYQSFYAFADVNNKGNLYQERIRIEGIGVPVEASFHPYIKENFSLGFLAGAALGTTPAIFSSNDDKKEYFYYRWNLNGELAMGLKAVKLLFTINRTYQNDRYGLAQNAGSSNQIDYEYKGIMEQQISGLGFRIGRYLQTGYKPRHTVDLLYTFTERELDGFLSFDPENLTNYAHGLSLSWWKISKFKFKFDIQLAESGTMVLDSEWSQPNFQISLILNWNRFY